MLKEAVAQHHELLQDEALANIYVVRQPRFSVRTISETGY